MRSLILGCLALLPNAHAPVLAQEPLFLRILPNDARPAKDGGAPLSDADIAVRARAVREAVWQRADRRAHLAIASVCKGCLKEDFAADQPASSAAATPTVARSAESLDDAVADAATLSLADSR